jgi:hypothetical protein
VAKQTRAHVFLIAGAFLLACRSTADDPKDSGSIAADAAAAVDADVEVDVDAGIGADAEPNEDASTVADASADDASSDGGARDSGPIVLAKAYTEHLGRLTETPLNPLRPLGMIGTDLGVSFEHDGRLVFLFGDSWLTGPDLSRWDDDSAAWTELAYPADGTLPRLNWYQNGAGTFLTLAVPGVNLKGFNVPVEGLVLGGTTYLFFTTGFSNATGRHTHSVLTHLASPDFSSIEVDHVVPSDKFFNVSIVSEPSTLWIFSSGHYRQSAVHLAKVAPEDLIDRSRWTYYRGLSNGQPEFGPDEASAVPIVDASCVGELSVRKHPALELYLMSYNCDSPRGIHLRYAPSPVGPWSEPLIIFDPAPDQDRGYQHFIHANRDVLGYDDGLSEPGRESEWGGEYGPYLIPQWFTTPSPGVHSILYVLSSWNPYQVHLMRTVLTEPGATAVPPDRGAGLPPASLVNGDFANGTTGWQAAGDPFAVFIGDDGRPRLTTFVEPEGDAATGRLWQDFTVDSLTSELRFEVHGGTAAVELLRGTEVVRSTRGQNANSPELPVRWQLSSYRGETLRLMIRDDEVGAWGFIGTTGFELD